MNIKHWEFHSTPMPANEPLWNVYEPFLHFIYFQENVIENRSTESPKRPNVMKEQRSWLAHIWRYTYIMLLWFDVCCSRNEHMNELVRVSADIIIINNEWWNDDHYKITRRLLLLILPNLKWKRVHRSYNNHTYIHFEYNVLLAGYRVMCYRSSNTTTTTTSSRFLFPFGITIIIIIIERLGKLSFREKLYI